MKFGAASTCKDPDARLVTFGQHADPRGTFSESFRVAALKELGLPWEFPQDCFSRSPANVLRGMHFQRNPLMGKLIRVAAGRALLVARNVHPYSAHFGAAFAVELSSDDRTWVWAPGWYARGYLALEPGTEVHYKCTAEYCAASDAAVSWCDPTMTLMSTGAPFSWPTREPSVSDRDRDAPILHDALRAGLLDFAQAPS